MERLGQPPCTLADQPDRDVVGGEEGTEAQQVDGRAPLLLDLLDGQGEADLNGPSVMVFGSLLVLPEAGTLALEQASVPSEVGSRLDVSGSLGQCQRQPAEQARHLAGAPTVILAGSLDQERDRGVAVQVVNPPGRPDLAPAWVEAGHQDVAPDLGRKVRDDLLRLRGVVEDQQPVLVVGQPAADGGMDSLEIGRVWDRQAERPGHRGEVVGQAG
jgi:hypothetical protein